MSKSFPHVFIRWMIRFYCDVMWILWIGYFSSVMAIGHIAFSSTRLRFMDLLTMVFSVLTFYGSEHIYLH